MNRGLKRVNRRNGFLARERRTLVGGVGCWGQGTYSGICIVYALGGYASITTNYAWQVVSDMVGGAVSLSRDTHRNNPPPPTVVV